MDICLVNGIETDLLTVRDRAFTYGHAVFETIALDAAKALLLSEHLSRLQLGCERLAIPFDLTAITEQIHRAVALANSRTPVSVLKVMVTMGEGNRGYANPVQAHANIVISVSPFPVEITQLRRKGAEIGLVDVRLAQQPLLAGIKHSNRLEQILARAQWQPHWHEALVRDSDDCIIEATHSNLFLVFDDVVATPDLSQSGVNGVMRAQIMKILQRFEHPFSVRKLHESDVLSANEVFLCNSLIGIMPVIKYQQHCYEIGPLSLKILTELEKNGSIALI